MGDRSKTYFGPDAAKRLSEFCDKHPLPPTRHEAVAAIKRICAAVPMTDDLRLLCRWFGVPIVEKDGG